MFLQHQKDHHPPKKSSKLEFFTVIIMDLFHLPKKMVFMFYQQTFVTKKSHPQQSVIMSRPSPSPKKGSVAVFRIRRVPCCDVAPFCHWKMGSSMWPPETINCRRHGISSPGEATKISLFGIALVFYSTNLQKKKQGRGVELFF